MKKFLLALTCLFCLLQTSKVQAQSEPYTIELEQINMPGTPAIHSFAFAESNGKWLFIGGRTNGLHGFNANNSFPKQYSNKTIYVVDPVSSQTWSKNIFIDCSVTSADPLRSTNMQYTQVGDKLYMIGGYGYDSLLNDNVTFPIITVIDVGNMIQAVISGTPINLHIRQLSDPRFQVCGGELQKLGDYFYLFGGHNFTGTYMQFGPNNQVYSSEIKKFKITDNGVNIGISDYSFSKDTIEYHRRDMNMVNAINPDGVTNYLILYGGVFKHGRDLPYVNPIYIDESSVIVDYAFEQKMSQYTCSYLSAFDSKTGSMHTTFFGGMSLYYFNEINHMQEYDSLVPFIDDITTLTRNANGTSVEKISQTRLPALLGTNAKFILNKSLPHFNNGIIKLDEISGRTFAGYIFGGIRALYPNNNVTFPSNYILKVYITPKIINIHLVNNEIPSEFQLGQNFPNPFNPVTKINYSLPKSQFTILKVYDVLGKEITTLVNENQNAGRYEVDFEGSHLNSGIYFYKLIADGVTVDAKRMMLLK